MHAIRQTAAVLALATMATMAAAKGHDQGSTADPGADPSTTVAAAHTLGGVIGNSSNTPAADNDPKGKGPK